MNSKKRILLLTSSCLLLMISFSLAQNYDGMSGNELIENWKAYQRANQKQIEDTGDGVLSGVFIGYVVGVCDILESLKLFTIPNSVIPNQLFMVVGKYLDNHPEDLHKQGVVLVCAALTEAFPNKQ